MTKGAKLIVIILAILFLLSLFLAIQINSSKEALIQQYSQREGELTQRAEGLSSKVTSLESEKRRLESRLSSIDKDIQGLSAERDDWKRKYDAAVKEKEDLLAKVKTIPQVVEKPSEEAKSPVSPDAYWAQVLKERAELELRINELKNMLSDTSIQLEEAKKSKAEFDVELTKLKQSNEDLEKKVTYGTDLANNLSLELAKEKNERRATEDRVGKLREENLSLRYQIKELTSAKVTLEKGLQRLVADKDKLSRRLEETEQIVQSRINDVLAIKRDIDARLGKTTSYQPQGESKPIELAPIVVKSGASAAAKPGEGLKASRAKIVSIDEANNFVIIDIGENSGVNIGDKFKVFRDNNQIASIEVIQTRKEISAADIKQKSQDIQAGDLVK